jgi:hypothetical protein
MRELLEWDLKEVSRETFKDYVDSERAEATVGEPIDDDDVIVSHYHDPMTGAYLGTIRLTEDGPIYLLVDEIQEPLSVEEATRLINGE